MKILYVANVRMPTEKAHGIQIMKTCEAFVRAGAELELIVPTRKNPIQEPAFEYYGMRSTFRIVYLPVMDTVGWGRPGFLFQTARFARAARRYVKTQSSTALIYGRDERVLKQLLSLGRKVVWETHTGAWNSTARKLVQNIDKLIVISGGLKKEYIARGVSDAKIVVAHDGVDVGSFVTTLSKSDARKQLQLKEDVFTIAYIGKFGKEKGTPTFFEMASKLPDTMQVFAVGGTPEEIHALRNRYPMVNFIGPRPYRELPSIQIAADALILPNTGTQEVSSIFTSPLKLFTSMASGVPIIAADVPSLREILDDSMAFFAKPDDPESFCEMVQFVAQNRDRAHEKASHALRAVENYTWDARARTILTAV